MLEVSAVLEIISSVSSTLALDEILAGLTEKTAEIVGAEGCTISRWDRENETITVLANYIAPQTTPPAEENIRKIDQAYSLANFPATTQVLHTHCPLTIYRDDPTADEAEKSLLKSFQWGGVLLMPMLYKGQAIGLMELYTDDRDRYHFMSQNIELCQALANQAAVAIENARLYEQAREGQLYAEALQTIGRALASELDYKSVVRMVADYVHPLVGAQFVCVAVPQGEKLRIVATAEETERSIKYSATRDDNFSSFVCDRCLQSVVLNKRYKVNPDIQNQAYCQFCQSTAKIWGWRGMAIIPLLANEELVGVLATYADCPNFFDASKIARLMALASQAAIAIQNAHYFATLEAQQVALQQLSVRLVTAQEEERRQLSRELHDEMGQTLTALRINLDLTQRLLPPHMPDKLRNALTEARRLAILTQETARNLSLQLRPAVLDDLGLVSALRWKLNQHKQRTNQMVHFEVDLPEVALRPELEITIYRIVGEALTNIVRHAQASQTCVSLKIKGDELLVSIEDDGVGFKSASKRASVQHSLGLINMQERAQLLGGHLQINSKIGQGTLVQANFPRPFFYQNKEIQI